MSIQVLQNYAEGKWVNAAASGETLYNAINGDLS